MRGAAGLSEYQYYEFAAVDRPLGARDLDALRGLSTRAHITPTSFADTNEWGSFKGDPWRLVERYFDAFLYLPNWGTRELIVRLPARLVDPDVAKRYCSGDAVSLWSTGDHVVVAAVSEYEEGDFEWARGGGASLDPAGAGRAVDRRHARPDGRECTARRGRPEEAAARAQGRGRRCVGAGRGVDRGEEAVGLRRRGGSAGGVRPGRPRFRLEVLPREHGSNVTFVERLGHAGL